MLDFLLETVFNPSKTYNLFWGIVIIGCIGSMIFNIRKEVKEYGSFEGNDIGAYVGISLIGFIPVLNAVLVIGVVILVLFMFISLLFERVFKNHKKGDDIDEE